MLAAHKCRLMLKYKGWSDCNTGETPSSQRWGKVSDERQTNSNKGQTSTAEDKRPEAKGNGWAVMRQGQQQKTCSKLFWTHT